MSATRPTSVRDVGLNRTGSPTITVSNGSVTCPARWCRRSNSVSPFKQRAQTYCRVRMNITDGARRPVRQCRGYKLGPERLAATGMAKAR